MRNCPLCPSPLSYWLLLSDAIATV